MKRLSSQQYIAEPQDMKFLKTFHKVTAIFLHTAIFLLINFNSASTYANEPGTPYIQVFFFKDFSFNSKNFSLAQNHQGLLFVGNFNGILEYDGSTWKHHKFEGSPFLSATKDEVVYAGGLNQFGFLSCNKLNQTEFVSLLDRVPDELFPFGQITSLKAIENKVYFSSENHLLMWDGDTLHALETKNRQGLKLFVLDSLLATASSEKGIQFYFEGVRQEFPSGSFFINKMVEDILPFGNDYLVKTEEHGFFILNKNTVDPFVTDIQSQFQRYGYSTGKILSDGNYVFGTNRGGILLMNQSGKLINHIRKDHGLLEDNVSFLYVDHSDDLWVVHNNGLSRVEIPSPVSYFDRVYGLRGNVSSIIRHKGTIYFATSQGIFYLDKEDDNLFSRIVQVEGIRNSCYNFYALGDLLFASSEAGIIQIKENTAHFIYTIDLETAIASEKTPRLVYLGLKDGFAAIHYDGAKWSSPSKIPSMKHSVISIAEENDEVIWAGTDYNDIFRIRKNQVFENSEVEHFKSGNGLPKDLTWVTVYKTASGIIFSTSHGVYRYNLEKRYFYSDTLLGIDFEKREFSLSPIVEDNDKNLWFNKHNHTDQFSQAAVAFYSSKTGKYRFVPLPLQRKKDFNIKTIYPDENGAIWFGGFNGVMRLDTTVLVKKDNHLHALISKVIWDTDSIIYYGSNDSVYKNEFRRFSFPINAIRFDFSTTNFESESNAQFQYKLEGFDKDWSFWSRINFKEYTNLPGKEYAFNLRVKNLQGDISEITRFSFTFVPPFYRTWWAYTFYILILVLFINMIIRQRAMRFAKERFRLEEIINSRTEELLVQKEKSEELLANLLPKDTADEIKLKGKASSHKYNLVTVLFSDIEGFTRIAEQMNPEVLVDELDKFFFKFDSVVEKFNIEKIKTIGDAYMCAGGIPDKNRTNPVDVILAALEMVQYMKQLQQENAKVWDLRIGIHTGPVIAGVVGQKKLSYDIWGDTVNTASRMESSGEPGKVNISGSTHELVNDFFACEYRGMMPVKYKGNIDMYFVKGIRPELSEKSKGLEPNHLFFIKLQLLRLLDLEEVIFERLENDLLQNLHFHNFKHTLAVCSTVELLGRAENLSEENMLIVRTAAAFIDAGYLHDYRRNADYRCEFAREMLPRFKYSEEQTLKVCHLLSVSIEKLSPTNQLEKILLDAYYDYLGRVDLPDNAKSLFLERRDYGMASSETEWLKEFIVFVQAHEFFTETAEKMRDYSKEEQVTRLQKLLN